MQDSSLGKIYNTRLEIAIREYEKNRLKAGSNQDVNPQDASGTQSDQNKSSD